MALPPSSPLLIRQHRLLVPYPRPRPAPAPPIRRTGARAGVRRGRAVVFLQRVRVRVGVGVQSRHGGEVVVRRREPEARERVALVRVQGVRVRVQRVRGREAVLRLAA